MLKCALTLARNEREARKILLARLPMLEHGRLAGHTGGNLLLSMMEQYTGDFHRGRRRPARAARAAAATCRRSPIERASICAEYTDGSVARGEVDVDAGQAAGQSVDAPLARAARVDSSATWRDAIRSLDAIVIGPGSFFTSLLPIFLVDGCREAIADVRGPVIYIANLLTEGRGMSGFTAGEAATRLVVGDRPADRRRRVQCGAARRGRAVALRARTQSAAANSATCRRAAS